MRRALRTALVAMALSAMVALPAAASSQSSDSRDAPGRALRTVGLTDDGRLVSFRSNNPGNVDNIGRVSGLRGDRSLVGIDFRVQDGKLYGVGDRGGIYTLSTRNAAATKVSQLTVALSGNAFGVDFNPAANRLRVISDNGQNLRHNIDDPNGMPARGQTATDAPLTTPPTAGTTTGVTAAAYTNNDLNASTATTLFDINTSADQTVIQSPANAGTLAATGSLGVDAGGSAGFDIYSTLRGGVTADNDALATLRANGRYRLYWVELLTGKASQLGSFPQQRQVVDLAIQLNQG